MSKLTSEKLEELQSFGRYFETMGNLINILRRGAMSVRYTELDYDIFCDEIEGALELIGKVQKEITDKFWDFVDFMEMDPTDPDAEEKGKGKVALSRGKQSETP